jgi:hypothetical protein
MDQASFTNAVGELLSTCIFNDADLQGDVEPGKFKTLSAYAELFIARRYQSEREALEVAPVGGSQAAREIAQEISSMVRMEAVLRALANPAIMRQASRL